jgi:lauroyl/myristoyl acyltransferase
MHQPSQLVRPPDDHTRDSNDLVTGLPQPKETNVAAPPSTEQLISADGKPLLRAPNVPNLADTEKIDSRRARFRLEERREFRYHLSVAIAITFSWIVRLTPERLRNWLADRGGDFFHRFSPTYRQNVTANVAQVMGLPDDSPEVRAATKRVFRASGRNFSDLLLSPHMTSRRIAIDAELVSGDWSILDNALAEGKGAVIVTAHVGSFDFLGKTLQNRGYKLNSLTSRTTARFLFDGVSYLRRKRGPAIIEASPSGVRKVIQGIRKGECAVLACDRDFFQNGMPVTFFGRETTLPPGAIRFARETGAPIVPLFAVRLEKGRGITIEPSFYVEKTKNLEEDLAKGMAKIVPVLEKAIRALPDQWVMFQRVWPLEPVDPVRVFPIGSPLESELLERVGAALPGPVRRPGRKHQDRDASPKDRTEEHQ